MSTKFFNNATDNTLFDKLKGIAQGMSSLDRFWAVAGYFRSSGYFRLRRELDQVGEIKILVGIEVDDLFRRHNQALLFLADPTEARRSFDHAFEDDIRHARYSREVEQGIVQMADDLQTGRLQLRIHPTRNLHAKFYLCLPREHTPNTDGWVIMGSSNLTDSGMGLTQAPRYELNVAMKDYDDVHYCVEEFQRLWDEGEPLKAQDIAGATRKTYLGMQPTPWEIYMKVLIDVFGDQVEDDFSMELPAGVMDLRYQRDAVVQGYQIMMKHNGVFLADVVGLGKTIIATMIAKRFIEVSGRQTHVLVVFPPALERTWKDTFKQFAIPRRQAHFVTSGRLGRILQGKDNYHDPIDYDLIIVDEAHGFRNDSTGKFDELQRICRAPRSGSSDNKKVMLLSATPLNNRPEDLLNQLLLFQEGRRCTIDGVRDVKAFFTEREKRYRVLMAQRQTEGIDVTQAVDQLYEEIRNTVIDKVTVRRTRHNILANPDYRDDLQQQGVVFPRIAPPQELIYQMTPATSARFYRTLAALAGSEDSTHLEYARYRAVEFLKPGRWDRSVKEAKQVAQILSGIYRVHMVKRLESSFHAFRRSLATLLRITVDMLSMYDQDKVLIIPKLNVKELQAKDMELDEIIQMAVEKKGYKVEEIVFHQDDFSPDFRKMLQADVDLLRQLDADWAQEDTDPKFDEFARGMHEQFLDTAINPTGQLVIFSESVDTLDYLYERLTLDLQRQDVLMVTSHNRQQQLDAIRRNFDANHDQHDDNFHILLSSDVMAEGVNLHRANVIINYDSPWNATRLMQRIGRVNRIGSQAEEVHNFLFYPSAQGDKEIGLYKNALIKLQGFHSALGEDAQVFSREEILHQFELFDSQVRDSVDRRMELLREVRQVYQTDRAAYRRIKDLPDKCRVVRTTGQHTGQTVAYMRSRVKAEFYLVDDHSAEPLDTLTAIDTYLHAERDEPARPIPTDDDRHYEHVRRAHASFGQTVVAEADTDSHASQTTALDRPSLQALAFLRGVNRLEGLGTTNIDRCKRLANLVERGAYAQLPKRIVDLSKQLKNIKKGTDVYLEQLTQGLTQLSIDYLHIPQANPATAGIDGNTLLEPNIIISETFL